MEYELIKGKVYYRIFDRTDKVSSGVYNIYNYTDDTKISEAKQNIHNVKIAMRAADILMLKQVHGNKVVLYAKSNDIIEADASVTDQKNIVIAIKTADCVPVLFASKDGEMIGGAHCGWKSAKADIIKNTVKKMQNMGAGEIKALIGPAIAQESYEVSKDFYNDFMAESKNNKKFFIPSVNKEHFMFDLPGFVKQKLYDENVEIVEQIQHDTYQMSDKYPSFRRDTHQNQFYKLNILSTIIMR